MNAMPWSGRRWLILFAAGAGMVLTASLGQWQLGRADQKLALVAARATQAAMAPLNGLDLVRAQELASDSPDHLSKSIYRSVRIEGQWLAQGTVYLDNRQMQGRTGFYVLTPMRLKASNTVVLVQRGWVPRSFTDRSALPALSTPQGDAVVAGQLAPWPSRTYALGGDDAGPIRQNLDWVQYRAQTNLPLIEWSVVQTDDSADGLLRDWPAVATGIEKHHGYAFQWFGLCTLIASLYVWFQIVQPLRKK